MTKIIIQGINGRMGKALCSLISQRKDCEIVAGVDLSSTSEVPTFKTLNEVNIEADVLIDFSSTSATMASIDALKAKKMPCVICTTGFNEHEKSKIEELSKIVPVFQSANMSVGVNLLIELAKKANALLGTDYDIEIIEKHHHNKVDAPSGTALMIADEIKAAATTSYEYKYDRHAEKQKRQLNEIGIHAVRGGGIVGDHDVLFCGANETITLSHSAASREVFASGAISAALFIKDKKQGMFNMKDLIK